MCFEPDPSTRLAGLNFRNPILVSSSEFALSPSLLKNLGKIPIGGIVTKTFTSLPQNRIRVRPYQFPLNAFGKGYKESGGLYSLAAPHVEDMESAIRRVRGMATSCHDASLKLIASFFEDPADLGSWARHASDFEGAGADMIELNFSSPSAVKIFAQSIDASTRIVRQVKEQVSVPVGLKLSPTLEPLENFVEAWSRMGLDFITAHNAPSGILVDVENQVPFGAPVIGGYVMGRAFLPYSLARVVRIQKVTPIPVIGVGGIYDAADALQYLLCGCRLVGIGSALYFQGMQILDDIYEGLIDWMQRKAYRTVDEFRGTVLPLIRDPVSFKSEEKYPFSLPPDCPYIPVVLEERCNRCGLCERACTYGALSVSKDKWRVLVDEARCWSCGFCVGLCPFGAIELRDRKNPGKVIWNNQGMAEPFRKPLDRTKKTPS
jgi:dihydroorotate dehydrogenase/NAD-dependent dihydropyrimidine dehydrogenase PreA subunit